MTDIDVPDWVVMAAMLGEQKFYAEKRYTSFSDVGATDAADAMKAAISAAWLAWGLRVGYQETITIQDDGVFEDIEQKLWHWMPGKPIPESTTDVFREPLYTLRQEKPE